MISMIAAIGKNLEIGKNNKLLWRIPRDMKFFKDTTDGHIVIMGRKTYESLPAPLSNRKMLVITSKEYLDVDTCNNIEELVKKYQNAPMEVFIIGGASIYEQFIEYASCLYLTEIDAECSNADSYFPNFDKNCWESYDIDAGFYGNLQYKIKKYIKK